MPAFEPLVRVYECPDAPPHQRFVAHWFMHGAVQVAMQLGRDRSCGEELRRFLTTEIAKQTRTKGEVDPAVRERMKRASAAAAAKRQKRNEPDV